ncbi:MAG: hypothetical protein RL656_1185 [Bacteroidota bacterium]
MNGLTEKQITNAQNKFLEYAKKENLKPLNTFFQDEWYSNESMSSRGVLQTPLFFLAKSLEYMSKCTTVYFAKGWENARGCKIEHEVALQYGLDIIYE